MVLYIILSLVVLLFIYILTIYNGFVKLSNTVKEAFSTMDVYLKKRWELIPNIVETVKGYVKHEKETLEEVVRLRNSPYDSMSNDSKIKANEQLTHSISKVMALAESYPLLKANENFLDLSRQLAQVEEDIANARKYYNAVVKKYNNKVQMFPSNLIAKKFGYSEKSMFEISENQRENVKINF